MGLCTLGNKGENPLLAAGILTLGETLLAVNRTVSTGLEGNLAFLLTIRAGRLVHLPLSTTKSTTTATLKSHVFSFV